MARQLVEARLAACVQSIPIRSTYRWKGKIEHSRETLLLAKTRRSHERQMVAFIRRHHPYELPEVVAVPIVGGLPNYLQWIANETVLPRTRARPRRN